MRLTIVAALFLSATSATAAQYSYGQSVIDTTRLAGEIGARAHELAREGQEEHVARLIRQGKCAEATSYGLKKGRLDLVALTKQLCTEGTTQ